MKHTIQYNRRRHPRSWFLIWVRFNTCFQRRVERYSILAMSAVLICKSVTITKDTDTHETRVFQFYEVDFGASSSFYHSDGTGSLGGMSDGRDDLDRSTRGRSARKI